jgi:hypothetical protein
VNIRTLTKETRIFLLSRDDLEALIKDEHAPFNCVASFVWDDDGSVTMTAEYEEEEQESA